MMKRSMMLIMGLSAAIAMAGCSTAADKPAETKAVAETKAPADTKTEGTKNAKTSASGAGEAESRPEEKSGSGAYEPSKSFQFVVPFEAGGNSDIPARIFAKYMGNYSSQSVEVVNITGAGGRVGAKEVMNAEPDGSTLLMQPVGYPMQYAMGVADFTYEDFDMIGTWCDSSLALVVKADSPYQTLDDLIHAAKEKPETIKMGSVTGTLPLFAILEIEKQKDVKFHKVDLSGGSKAPELLGGRVDGYIDGFASVKQYIDGNQFRCLAVINDRDIEGYEQLDNFQELGFTNYDYLKQTFGMWAPKGTPEEAVDYVNHLIKQASEDPDCIAEMKALSYDTSYTTVEEYTNLMKDTYAAFEEAAKGITAQ